MDNNTQYGVLHEIGDLSLGFQPLSESDNKTYDNYIKNKASDTDKDNNKEKSNK